MTPDENDIIFTQYGLDIEAIVRAIYRFFGGGNFDEFYAGLLAFWEVYSVIAFVLSAALLFGIVYSTVRFHQLFAEEQRLLREEEHAYKHAYGTTTGNTKWNMVQEHTSSDNPNDWRLAIIEADIMLDELLMSLGYVGTSIGDKLKTANPEAFRTLDDAWEAHKVRNRIAHTGSDFVLTRRLAHETIARYKRVFDEFKVT